ncbi:MAG TPA: AraC family transcriptional regulator [Clostridia bacterium]|nr:AraC family transcriptional regulator [Clostridia bacterium]
MKIVHVCGRRTEPPVCGHVVNFPRLEVVLSGCYENRIEDAGQPISASLSPGEALFAPANCWNLPAWRHPVQLLVLLFGKKQLGVSIVDSAGGAHPGLTAQKYARHLPVTGPVPRVLEAMIEVAAGGPLGILPELARALLSCVGAAIQENIEFDSAPRTKSLLEEVCVYLQNHYQFDVTRESVARQFGVSPNYLSRVFQIEGQMTFSNYLMRVRTDRAKHLLRSYNLKLDDVAARCGYRDASYFCRVFRKLTKVTPADYRAQHRLNGALVK